MSTLGRYIRNKMGKTGSSDRSGYIYNAEDMVKQMEWRGDSLQWTGIMVGRDEVDKPCPNLKPFKAKPESIPPSNYRPYQVVGTAPPYYGPTLSTQQILKQLKEYVPHDDV